MHLLVAQYIESQPESLRQLLWQIRDYILVAIPQVEERFMFRCPFYVYCGWLCYFFVRKGHIEWSFCQGAQLSNESGLLLRNGRKQVAHIVVNDAELFESDALAELLQEAVLLNESCYKQFKTKKAR